MKVIPIMPPSSALKGSRAIQKEEALVHHIWEWITHDLSKQDPQFNNMPPCPFARRALFSNRVIFHMSKDHTVAVDIKSVGDLEGFTHVLIWTNPKSLSPKKFKSWIDGQNINHFGNWMMGMHPFDPLAKKSVWKSLNMDDWGIVLVQSLTELDTASAVLMGTTYYHGIENASDLIERRIAANAWNEKGFKEKASDEEEVIH